MRQVQVCEAHHVADALWKLLQGFTPPQVQVCEAHQVADALWKLRQGTAP
jgi:predicted ribosome-associated RNA-binding protein Tma20